MDPADYMIAICGDDALRELSSPGKSGSFFYLTQDDRFMIKTVKKSEVKVSRWLLVLTLHTLILYLCLTSSFFILFRCFYVCFQITTNISANMKTHL